MVYDPLFSGGGPGGAWDGVAESLAFKRLRNNIDELAEERDRNYEIAQHNSRVAQELRGKLEASHKEAEQLRETLKSKSNTLAFYLLNSRAWERIALSALAQQPGYSRDKAMSMMREARRKILKEAAEGNFEVRDLQDNTTGNTVRNFESELPPKTLSEVQRED